ncbi:MAG: SdiA-regulated domain-containing protein [Kofleriaceae bacterium]
MVEIDPFIDNDKADGHSTKLRLLDHHKLDVDEPSDLTFANGKLYTISDQHSKIYEIDGDGDTQKTIDITGNDLEALAYDESRGQFVMADESSSKLWYVDDDGDRHDAIELDADDGNSGIEGLAFADNGHLFVAKEKDPARIFELDADGKELDRKKIDWADDLSALAWNSEDGHLYALSDQDHALFRLEKDLDVDHAWKLPIDKPEGIAFDGDTLYVVSDSEEKIYIFELDRD